MHSSRDSGKYRPISHIGFTVLVLCVLIASLHPLRVTAQATGPIYIVQPGDTLFLIAQRFGTTVDDIAIANNITDPSIITPGTELIIPGYEGVTGTLEFHEITYGETSRSVSHRFHISEPVLFKLNRILIPSRIYLGQALIVPVSQDAEPQRGYQVQLAQEVDNRIAFAARNGLAPWSVSKLSSPLQRAWIIPNETLVIPGDGEIIHSLPGNIQHVEVSPQKVIQGNTLVISLQKIGSNPIQVYLGEQLLAFNTGGTDQLIALQGIHALKEPGMYDLEIQVLSDEGARVKYSYRQPVRIADGEYYYDPVLYVPAETIDPEKTRPENELITNIISQVTEEKHWDGVLAFPTSYTESFPSYFGSRRNYNGQGYQWYHSGLDLFGGTGTEIFAPANGRVVFAGPLEVRGNVTFIDHGWGVFTGYLHQSSIEVSEGDWVETGQLIGYVGATGRVTGPHLHWEVWVGGVPVDPLEWTSKVFP